MGTGGETGTVHVVVVVFVVRLLRCRDVQDSGRVPMPAFACLSKARFVSFYFYFSVFVVVVLAVVAVVVVVVVGDGWFWWYWWCSWLSRWSLSVC